MVCDGRVNVGYVGVGWCEAVVLWCWCGQVWFGGSGLGGQMLCLVKCGLVGWVGRCCVLCVPVLQ